MSRVRTVAIPWILGTFAITLATASAAPDSDDPRSGEFFCMSEAVVHVEFEEAEGEEEEEEEPFDLYCLARCEGEHANPGFVPVAGPASPAEILAETPYVDPFKWCEYVAEKACRRLGPDHKLAESCFGSRL